MNRRARLRRFLSRIGRRPVLESAATTLAFLAGLALVAAGCALIFLPAGLIVGGAQLTVGAVLYARGRQTETAS